MILKFVIFVCILVISSNQNVFCGIFPLECQSLPKCRYSKDLTSMDCSHLGLTTIPIIPEGIFVFNLDYNFLTAIPRRAFSTLSKLKTLKLNHNKITSIEPFAFEGLDKVTVIEMKKNAMINVGDKSFANIPRLQNLMLTFNSIRHVSSSAFDGTPVTTLNLSGNKLSTIPMVACLSHLRCINLYNNQVVNPTFPSACVNGSRTLSVGLSENKIVTLQNSTFLSLTGVSVTEMVLSNNNISTVDPGTFLPLTSVMSLKLNSNPIRLASLKSIADELANKSLSDLDLSGVFSSEIEVFRGLSFFKNTDIKTLALNGNGISNLPDNAFKDFREIEFLELSKNKLSRFNAGTFSTLHRLRELKLDKNGLTSFPRYLPTSLEVLNLIANRIKNIQTDETRYLHNLRRLFLKANNIVKLESGAFHGLENLLELDLSNNQIGVLSGSLFKPLKNLTNLSLTGNNIRRIFKVCLDPLKMLSKLDISGNDWNYMQENSFESLTRLRKLYIQRNNLSCYFTEKIGNGLFKGLKELEEIDISNNNIVTLSDTLFQDQLSLKVLKLHHNKLSGWSSNLFKYTTNLSNLDVSHNQIPVLSENNLHYLNELEEMNLIDNPFVCNCDLLWFRGWLDRTTICLPEKQAFTCKGPEKWRGKSLLAFTKDKINCTFLARYAIVIAGSASAALLISTVSGSLVYRNRWRIRLRLYLLTKRGRRFLRRLAARNALIANDGSINNDNDQEIYDAYISCTENDNDWILQHLLPGIDNGLRHDDDCSYGGDFKLYFDPRDFDPGVSAVANIFEHMTRSKRLIVILTQHYKNSTNEFELDQAVTLLQKHKLKEIIVIKVGDVPAKRVPVHLYTRMENGLFLEWEDNEIAIETFKRKLKDKLIDV